MSGTQEIATNGTTIHVRVGGKGPAVVLLHGYGETGDMWAPMAADLARDHTVIVPDLRGMGLSSKPAGGYDKKTQAGDVAGVLDALKIDKTDWSPTTSATWSPTPSPPAPKRVTRLVLIDAPVPGVGPWEEILKNPLLWHFRFGGPDMERWSPAASASISTASGTSSRPTRRFTEASREHYAKLYACRAPCTPASRSSHAFDQDAVDNKAFLAQYGKLTMPVLALGGEKSFGPMMATVMRFAADNVTEGVVPASGHWIMEENPTGPNGVRSSRSRSTSP
jgi:pimeloyl-ACP methyl ester carboxylesterase